MRRVVITGIGIVSSIGENKAEVLNSLKLGKSGITFSDDYAENGFRSQVHGNPKISLSDHIDKRQLRFMGDGAAYNYIAMAQAIGDSGLIRILLIGPNSQSIRIKAYTTTKVIIAIIISCFNISFLSPAVT